MDYLEWVDHVFRVIVDKFESDDPNNPHLYGVQLDQITEAMGLGSYQFGDDFTVVADAVLDLHELGLLEVGHPAHKLHDRQAYRKPTRFGDEVSSTGLTNYLEDQVTFQLDDNSKAFLLKLVSMSRKEGDKYTIMRSVPVEELSKALGPEWTDDSGLSRVKRTLNRLEILGLIQWSASIGDDTVKPRVKGIAWVEHNTSGWQEKWILVADSEAQTGGLGKVRKMQSLDRSQTEALKELRPDLLRDTERRNRLLREVRLLESINIEDVPRVLDHNMEKASEKGKPLYMVVEWMPGQRLDKYIGQRPIKIEDAVRITRDLVSILRQCHAQGIQHRDIKPDNIMIDPDTDQVSILDFGLAWIEVETGQPLDFRTEKDSDLRNRFFSIPDLAPGRSRHHVQTDITQLLGVLLYMIIARAPRILTDEHGQPPHKAFAEEIRKRVKNDKLWPKLEAIFDKGFQPRVNDRFQTADELIEKLGDILIEEK